MRARGAAQSASALGTIKVVNSAQLSFAITCGLGFYSPDFQTLGVIPPASPEAFLSPEMASSVRRSSRAATRSAWLASRFAGAPASCNGLPASTASSGYAAVADPLDTAPQARYFGTNSDGIIYEDVASYRDDDARDRRASGRSALK